MKIGNVELNGNFILAPMAGVTDLAFREVCREHGAALSVSEMVSTKAISFGDKKSLLLTKLAPNEKPVSVQIFGHEPEVMARGAIEVYEYSKCDIIDINMGCPAPKIVNNGDGSALMNDIKLAENIITTVKKQSPVPVTVKFRLGWDENSKNYIEFAKMAQNSGADAICVHGRTRSQQYSGVADWQAIGEVKQVVDIPVIANGDVFEPQDAVDILKQTGADAAMIGRGSFGNPWIFERANALVRGQELPPLPILPERLDVAVRQMERAAQEKSERVAMLEARRHVNYYLKGVSCLKSFKVRISQLSTLSDLYEIAEEMKELYLAEGGDG